MGQQQTASNSSLISAGLYDVFVSKERARGTDAITNAMKHLSPEMETTTTTNTVSRGGPTCIRVLSPGSPVLAFFVFHNDFYALYVDCAAVGPEWQ